MRKEKKKTVVNSAIHIWCRICVCCFVSVYHSCFFLKKIMLFLVTFLCKITHRRLRMPPPREMLVMRQIWRSKDRESDGGIRRCDGEATVSGGVMEKTRLKVRSKIEDARNDKCDG